MDKLLKSCEEAGDYPRNVINHNTYDYSLRAYFERLNSRETRLFLDKGQLSLDFWDFNYKGHCAFAKISFFGPASAALKMNEAFDRKQAFSTTV